MDKKPLIVVSICAVVLLVLGSLSNVVGYQSVKSTVNDSPLFQTRTQRATNQQQNSITSQYIGKGKISNLLILQRLDKISSLHNVISRIQAMDDASFQRFIRIAVELLSKQEKLKDIAPQELITGLHQIRDNKQLLVDYTDFNDGYITWEETPTLCWYPFCLLGAIWVFTILLLILIIFSLPTSILCSF